MSSRVVLLMVFWLSASAVLAPARTLTVGGGEGAEFQSIQAAIDSALAGDVVEVAAGVYGEHIVTKSGVDAMGAGAERTTIVGNAALGFSVVQFDNVVNAKLSGFELTSDAPSPVIAYNDVWNNETNYEKYPDQTGLNGNISADPLFADESDLHLQGDSPAVDAGDPSSPPDPDGTRTDMGAFPYAESAGGEPSARTLECALDVDRNGVLGDGDIQQAIRLWVGGESVPGSDQTIDDRAIMNLIRKWISAERLACDLPLPQDSPSHLVTGGA